MNDQYLSQTGRLNKREIENVKAEHNSFFRDWGLIRPPGSALDVFSMADSTYKSIELPITSVSCVEVSLCVGLSYGIESTQ